MDGCNCYIYAVKRYRAGAKLPRLLFAVPNVTNEKKTQQTQVTVTLASLVPASSMNIYTNIYIQALSQRS